MSQLTLRQAERLTGKSRTALLKAIQRGRLSAQKDSLGQWLIDPAELNRVYPAMSTHERPRGQTADTSATVLPPTVDKIQHLEALLRAAEEERDHLRGLVDRLTGLLADQRTDQREKAQPLSFHPSEAPPATKSTRPLLWWLIGLLLVIVAALVGSAMLTSVIHPQT